MQTIAASEFKAKCLALIDEVDAAGTRFVITKRGKPVAELVRFTNVESGFPQESLRGTGRIVGDIVEPVVSSSDWNLSGER